MRQHSKILNPAIGKLKKIGILQVLLWVLAIGLTLSLVGPLMSHLLKTIISQVIYPVVYFMSAMGWFFIILFSLQGGLFYRALRKNELETAMMWVSFFPETGTFGTFVSVFINVDTIAKGDVTMVAMAVSTTILGLGLKILLTPIVKVKAKRMEECHEI